MVFNSVLINHIPIDLCPLGTRISIDGAVYRGERSTDQRPNIALDDKCMLVFVKTELTRGWKFYFYLRKEKTKNAVLT